MNDLNDKLKSLIKNFLYENEEDKLGEELGKILSILYGKKSLTSLNENDFNYLNKKNIISDSENNILKLYYNIMIKGSLLSSSSIENMHKILEEVALKFKKINEEWNTIDTCNKILKLSKDFNDLNENEINSIINLILNSNIDGDEKVNLLIDLSLSLSNKTPKI